MTEEAVEAVANPHDVATAKRWAEQELAHWGPEWNGPLAKLCRSFLALLSALPPPEREWRTMDSAPKDGTQVLLHEATGNISVGRWDQHKHRQKPKPYWHRDAGFWGITDMQTRQPTAWRPLPEPPSQPETAVKP
jgi:hypothetical protein